LKNIPAPSITCELKVIGTPKDAESAGSNTAILL
jgi:hypothetical protein